jgi:hypothetical protein
VEVTRLPATRTFTWDGQRVATVASQVEQGALDLQLRRQPPDQVDLDRLDLWARRLLADAAARDRGAVAGDVATLQVLWDRAGHAADPAAGQRVAAALRTIRAAPGKQDIKAAAPMVPALLNALSAAGP